MPYKFDRPYKKIPLQHDHRIKIMPNEYQKIRNLYNQGASIHKIAAEYNVCRRLIQFILFPERREKNLADREARGGWRQYYSTQRNTMYQRTMRKHRREVFGAKRKTRKRNDNNTNLDSSNGYTDIPSISVC